MLISEAHFLVFHIRRYKRSLFCVEIMVLLKILIKVSVCVVMFVIISR